MLKDAYVFTFYDDGTGSHQDGKDVDEEGSKTAGGKVTYVPVGSLNVLKKRRPVVRYFFLLRSPFHKF